MRLVRVAPASSDLQNSGDIWYCLSEPFGEAFVFPMLDRLFGDAARAEEEGLLIKSRGAVTHLIFSRICYMEVIGKTVFFHLDNGETLETTGTLSDFETRLLLWPDFIKVHRAYIVNLRYVERMESNSLLLRNGDVVPVSKHLYPQIKRDWLCGLMEPSEARGGRETVNDTAGTSEACCVLLVDDDEGDRIRFSRLLTGKGCIIRTADSGETALVEAAKGRYDCVVLDVRLGEVSGFDLCGQLRELTGAPVVYLSVLSDSGSQTQGFMTGGIDYITKDLTDELIWLKLRTRMEMARAGKAELSCGDLRLDLKKRAAYLLEQELPLTTVEFDLLCLLMRNPGVVYVPSRLYEMIWGAKHWDDGQTVQIHMSGLRRKLESISPRQSYIETVWGSGYRFASKWKGGGQDEE